MTDAPRAPRSLTNLAAKARELADELMTVVDWQEVSLTLETARQIATGTTVYLPFQIVTRRNRQLYELSFVGSVYSSAEKAIQACPKSVEVSEFRIVPYHLSPLGSASLVYVVILSGGQAMVFNVRADVEEMAQNVPEWFGSRDPSKVNPANFEYQVDCDQEYMFVD